jgi:hypothetical protein
MTAYTIQHNDLVPNGTQLPTVLLQTTDANGNAGTGGQYNFGPYLQSLPRNPYNERTDVKVIATGSPLTPDNTTAWLYRPEAAGFTLVANTTGTDSKGNPLVNY